MASRRFTEKQTAEIIRKASEIQARNPKASGLEGVGEDELRAAAAELGVDQAAIDAALESVEAGGPGERAGFWGGPLRQQSESVFDGQIADEHWEDIVADLRQTFGEPGKVERRGDTYEWSGDGGGVDVKTVTVRQSGNTVRLKLNSVLDGSAFVAYLLAMIPMFVCPAVLSKLQLAAPWSAIVAGLWMLLVFLSARMLVNRGCRKRERAMASLSERIRQRLATATATSARSLGAVAETDSVEAQAAG